MSRYKNEIEQFFYEISYHQIWEAIALYLSNHLYSLDFTYSRIKYPDSAVLEEMMLEFPSNIRTNEDVLFFDAVVSCTVILTKQEYYECTSCEINQWLRVSCEATITDKLESFLVSGVENYVPDRRKKENYQKLSKNIVPVISKDQLDTMAEDFLQEHFPQALENPMPVPIAKIAEEMGLKIIQGYRITEDFSIFGEIFFSEGTATVYDLFKCNSQILNVSRGTILIDTYTFWERNLGCINNTIAHEVFHWKKHRMYAAVKHLLQKKQVIACRCPVDAEYPNHKTEWTDEQRMEWQANNMAPRILMPLSTFKIKVEELLKRFDYQASPLKMEILVLVADELAKFYNVSRQSALIRMVETGYKEAAGIYQIKPDAKFHSYLNENDAFYEYNNNPEFRKIIDLGLFRYIDGYFIANDEKYIERDASGKSSLTNYAWAHLSKCALQFSWQQLSVQESEKHSPSSIFHRKNAEIKASKFDSNQNATLIEMSEELLRKREAFEQQNAMYKMTALNKSCWQLIFDLVELRQMSKAHFCNLTGLGEEVYRKAEKNLDTKPSIRTIVSIACGLDLDIATTEKLLQLAGHAFDESKESQALKFCVTAFAGRPIQEINDFLISYNYEPLGSKQRL